jgi:hypothetical protein
MARYDIIQIMQDSAWMTARQLEGTEKKYNVSLEERHIRAHRGTFPLDMGL